MDNYEINLMPAPDRYQVKVLGATFAPGKPSRVENGQWRSKLKNRAQKLAYLKSDERYLYGQNSASGSEKRKTPA